MSGCYPTAALLALLPLVSAKLIDPAEIIIDAKSGVSGAGRSLKQNILFSEAGEGISPYSIASHRHAPEIEQEISAAAGESVFVNFTPHLVPMSRGELVTAYVRLQSGRTASDLASALTAHYADAPFVRIAPKGTLPSTQFVRGSNYCMLGLYADRIPGRAIAVSAIDNLVKGSAGQAIQISISCSICRRLPALNNCPFSPKADDRFGQRTPLTLAAGEAGRHSVIRK